NIAEYTFRLPVGTGAYDVIGLHRSVRETAPWVPAASSRSLMLVHGDIGGFRAAFLTNSLRKLPVFLAGEGVDVWGIDLGWTLIPASVTHFGFLKNWGIERDARDLGLGLAVARRVRSVTDHDPGKMFLLGWSRGGQIGYAYLNGETQLPAGLRQVKGFIPVDIYLKTDVQELKSLACLRQQATEGSLAGNVFANNIGITIAAIGNGAIAGPGRTTGLVVGAATFALLGGAEPAPVYHFTGGTFDASGTPTGLLYSNERALFDFEAAASPFQPNQELADADAATCEVTDVPFDDHLAEITVPVFYVGAGGGFGEYGIYTTSLLGSTDVQTLVVSKGTERLFDYGHADLFLANDAQALVWQPILDWIQAH
ncbi:MAG TPA: hypothetical protein VL025_00580, partial [Thermoanaerobaculia bacterium]|nr:hypothetical protein [Thermoanaerobaculia bacterium]